MNRIYSNPFEGFGIIPQAILATAQAITLSAADKIEYDATKKYLASLKQTQNIESSTALENKQKQLELQEKISKTKALTSLFSDQATKKLVIIGGMTAISVAIIAIIVLYSISEDKGVIIKLKDYE